MEVVGGSGMTREWRQQTREIKQYLHCELLTRKDFEVLEQSLSATSLAHHFSHVVVIATRDGGISSVVSPTVYRKRIGSRLIQEDKHMGLVQLTGASFGRHLDIDYRKRQMR